METTQDDKKLLVFGDTHGHNSWKSIIEKEHPDKIMFLGDYFDCFDKNITYKMQVDNFKDILNLRNELGDNNVIIMLGNHDFHYTRYCSGEYSGYSHQLRELNYKLIEDSINNGILRVAYEYNNTIFSHAGITNYWLENVAKVSLDDLLNGNLDYKSLNWNSIKGSDPYGNTISNSPIWVRPKSLSRDNIEGYNQVVGHTNFKSIQQWDKLFFCDTMPNEYLTIINVEFKINKANENI